MASFFFTLFLSSLFLLPFSSLSHSSPFLLRLSKHPLTHHHHHHHHLTPLLLDLNSPFLSLNPLLLPHNISILPRRSLPCSASRVPDHPHHLCSFPLTNSLTGRTTLAHLAKAPFFHVDDFLFALAPGVRGGGVLGLGRNPVGVVRQLAHSFALSNKFSICLSSNDGFVLFGDNNHFDSMIYTPILADKTNSYRINLKSILINNKKITLTKQSSLKISTTTPYTLIKTTIYKEVITTFAAETLGMTRVNPIAGFELCYTNTNKNNIKKIPLIELVLQSEMVKWSIKGHNSMVKINDDVTCLGIMDGGDGFEDVIVLGSYQLEDNLVEFDLGRSIIGFSSSLLVKHNTCSGLSKGFGSGLDLGVSRHGNFAM